MSKQNFFNGYDMTQSNISVTLRYNELHQLMLECAKQGVEEYVRSKYPVTEPKWVNTVTAAKVFNKSTSTINRWKHRGYLTAHPIGGIDYFSMDDINELMGNNYGNN